MGYTIFHSKTIRETEGSDGRSIWCRVKRRLRFDDGRVDLNIGDTLFALDVDDHGDGDLLMVKYDIGSAALYVVM